VDRCLSEQWATGVPDQVIAQRGPREAIRSDDGPWRHFLAWREEHGIRLDLIEPDRPMQNGFIEDLNGRLPGECIKANWFATLADAKAKIEAWRHDYNPKRPQSSLGYLLTWGQEDSNANPCATPPSPLPDPGRWRVRCPEFLQLSLAARNRAGQAASR
jgi:transposase InsO family protein